MPDLLKVKGSRKTTLIGFNGYDFIMTTENKVLFLLLYYLTFIKNLL